MASRWALALAAERCVDSDHPSHVGEQCAYCTEAGEDLDAAYRAGEKRGRERAAAYVERVTSDNGPCAALAFDIRALPDELPKVREMCPDCGGKGGWESSIAGHDCETCGGSGAIEVVQ